MSQHERTVFRQRGSQQRHDAYEQEEKNFVRDVRFDRREEIERVARENGKRVSAIERNIMDLNVGKGREMRISNIIVLSVAFPVRLATFTC